MPTIPRESTEYLYVNVTRNGQATTDGVEFALTMGDTRPTQWTPAVLIDGRTAYLAQSLTPGIYHMWARTNTGDEQAVDEAGVLIIS